MLSHHSICTRRHWTPPVALPTSTEAFLAPRSSARSTPSTSPQVTDSQCRTIVMLLLISSLSIFSSYVEACEAVNRGSQSAVRPLERVRRQCEEAVRDRRLQWHLVPKLCVGFHRCDRCDNKSTVTDLLIFSGYFLFCCY